MIQNFLLPFLKRFIGPKSENEDVRRREFILNVLLAGFIVLMMVATIVDVVNLIFLDPVTRANNSLTLVVILTILSFFLTLYFLSRKGLHILASFFLISSLILLAGYMGYVWGFDVPASALFYVLIIVMSGVLISTRFAFFVTAFIGLLITVTGYLQITEISTINSFWKTQQASYSDVVMTIVVFFIIATVSWLSNREIERSLKRARKSEAELKEERDMLEVRVIERTKELRQAQMEKMAQSYKFIEFGRLAGGLFHDLMNPLTALSLNIESIAQSHGAQDQGKISTLSEDVTRAKRATEHMQKLMDSMRKHLSREGVREEFSLKESLHEIVQVLTPYARERGVTINLKVENNTITYGDAVAFAQIMTNLVSNAVDSYASVESKNKEVRITLSQADSQIAIEVSDFGSGISEEIGDQIFEPFFTTKESGRGLGIGLPLTKRVIEKEFDGSIAVVSKVNSGSTFTVQFPVREP